MIFFGSAVMMCLMSGLLSDVRAVGGSITRVNKEAIEFWEKQYTEVAQELTLINQSLASSEDDQELLDRKKRLESAKQQVLEKINSFMEETGGSLAVRSEDALTYYADTQYQKRAKAASKKAIGGVVGRFKTRRESLKKGTLRRDSLNAVMVMTDTQREALHPLCTSVISGMEAEGGIDPIRFYGSRLQSHSDFRSLYCLLLGDNFSEDKKPVIINGSTYQLSDYELTQYIALQMVSAYQREYLKNKKKAQSRGAKDIVRATELATVKTFDMFASRLWRVWAPLYFGGVILGISMQDAGFTKGRYSEESFVWSMDDSGRQSLHLRTLAPVIQKVYTAGLASVSFSDVKTVLEDALAGEMLPGSPKDASQPYYKEKAYFKGAESLHHAWARRWYELCQLVGKTDTFGFSSGSLATSIGKITASWDGELSRAAMRHYMLLSAEQNAKAWGLKFVGVEGEESLSEKWSRLASTYGEALRSLGLHDDDLAAVTDFSVDKIFTPNIADDTISLSSLDEKPNASFASYIFLIGVLIHNSNTYMQLAKEHASGPEILADLSEKKRGSVAARVGISRPHLVSSALRRASIPQQDSVDYIREFRRAGLSISQATSDAVTKIGDIAQSASQRLSNAVSKNDVGEMIAYITDVRASIAQLGEVLRLQSRQLVRSTQAISRQIQRSSELITIASQMVEEGLLPQVDTMMGNVKTVLEKNKGVIHVGIGGYHALSRIASLPGAKQVGSMFGVEETTFKAADAAQSALERHAGRLKTAYEGLLEEDTGEGE